MQTQVVAWSYLDEKFRQRSLLLLSKICKARGIIPTSYAIRLELVRIGQAFYQGGFGDVYDGEYLGLPVAVKRLRIYEGDRDRAFKVFPINLTYIHCSVLAQRLCREIIGWKHLSHPNILPLLGISVPANAYSFCILTEWMYNGNIMKYTKSNPGANRLQLVRSLAVSLYFLPTHQLPSAL